MKTSFYAAPTQAFDHVTLGMALFWEQEDPQDEYEYEGENWGTHACVVCGGSADIGSSVCGSLCYKALTSWEA